MNIFLYKIHKIILILIIGFFCFSFRCATTDKNYDDKSNDDKKYFKNAFFPSIAKNFFRINTNYDDFNSGPPETIESEMTLFFSSNRYSLGDNFDILFSSIYIVFYNDGGTLTLDVWEPHNSQYIDALGHINTANNEYAPFIWENYLFFASDLNGNLDIFYINLNLTNQTSPLDSINSDMDDAYLSSGNDGFIYFTSNRAGQFDLYKANITYLDIQSGIQSENLQLSLVEIINSSSDDKCPYINGDLLVFTSNREGGYGGFDLWFSKFVNNSWTKPVNFGEKINSEYDEYRPAVIIADEFENNLMLFSSNRKGGKGGFDLYYVGIPKTNE
jgi:hypothetical protein